MIIEDIIETRKSLTASGVDLKSKGDSKLMMFAGAIQSIFGDPVFVTSVWTRIGSTLYYPTKVVSPIGDLSTMGVSKDIERLPARLFPQWVYIIVYMFLPLPIFFAWFRWKQERNGLLKVVQDMVNSGTPLERVFLEADEHINLTWHAYGWCWPKRWMRKWLIRRIRWARQ